MSARWRNFLPMVAILALALMVRLPSLGERSLWYDEAFAVLFAEQGLDAMLYGTLTPVQGGASDIHPLLYYLTLDVWMRLVGQDVALIRLWGVLLGVASVGVLSGLLNMLLGRPVALWGGLLAALAPFHVHYSQEARMYGLLALLLMGATACYVQAERQTGRRRWLTWVAFGVCAGLAMYTQQLAAFYLLALALLPVLQRRPATLKGVMLGASVAVLIYAPWLVNIPAQFAKVRAYYWVERPEISDLFQTQFLFLSIYAELPALERLVSLALASVLALLALAMLWLILRQARYRALRSGVVVLLWLWLIPVLLMWGVSQVQPVYLERGLIASAMMLYGLIGWALAYAPRLFRALMLGCGATLMVLGLGTQYTLQSFPYSPMRELITELRSTWQDGDRLVHFNKLSALPARFYGRELSQAYLADPLGAPEDTLARPTQEALGFLASRDMASAVGEAERVWVLMYSRAEQQLQASGREDWTIAQAWLAEAGYRWIETRSFNDMKLYLYQR